MDLCNLFRFLGLAAALGFALAGCAAIPAPVDPFDTAVAPVAAGPEPALTAAPSAPPAPPPVPHTCPPLSPALAAEAARLTPVGADMSRALILSELRKNRALADALAAYRACRG